MIKRIIVCIIVLSLLYPIFRNDEMSNNSSISRLSSFSYLPSYFSLERDVHYDKIVNSSGFGDYTSIQEAINNSLDGEVIFIDSGTYNENIIVNRTVTLIGENPSSAIISGYGDADVLVITNNWVNLSSLQITNSGNPNAGIKLDHVNNCTIKKNSVSSNNDVVVLISSSHNIISENIIFGGGNSIYLKEESNNNIIVFNECSGRSGIFVEHSSNNKISNNKCNNNQYNGIGLYYSDFNIASNNTCNQNQNGMTITYSNNNIFSDNICESIRSQGISVYGDDNIIVRNKLEGNEYYGISVSNCNNNQIIENEIMNCKEIDISLYCATNVTLSENILSGKGIHINGDDISHWDTHLIQNSNLVQGKPIYYLLDENGTEIPDYFSQIIIVRCSNLTITNLNIGNMYYGIQIVFSNNLTIHDNICSGNRMGLYLYESSYNEVFNNTFSGNQYSGISAYNSNYNRVVNNICNSNEYEQNYQKYGMGISIFGGNNEISKNLISNNGQIGLSLSSGKGNLVENNHISNNGQTGLSLSGAKGNLVENNLIWNNGQTGFMISGEGGNRVIHNNISNNDGYGISVYSQYTGNFIYHNTFIDNRKSGFQAYETGIVNKWFDANKIGNYWSDLMDYDNDGDGIIESPYIIGGDIGGRDLYPLSKPIDELSPIARVSPDIVTDISQPVNISAAGSWSLGQCGTYTWMYEYGNETIYLSGQDQNLVIDQFGIYSISLTVKDALGRTDTDVVNVSVVDSINPKANPGRDITIFEGGIAEFEGFNSSDNYLITNYSWNFNYNGTNFTLFGENVSYQFNTSGNYSVTLRVTDFFGNIDEKSFNIWVKQTDASIPEIPDVPSEFDKDQQEDNNYSLFLIVIVIILLIVVLSLIFIVYKLMKMVERNKENK